MWSVPQPPTVAAPSSCLSRSDSWIQSSVDSFLKDGRKIRVGDCALFQAGNAPPFIGIIRWFTTSKEDCLNLCVNWLYRPSDLKLAKGILLEAAPNELFYSFHKDVISAASLLHPCKVAFLRKGVELPPGISSFVCRRVYDIANKCLWWLTDQDYINERQEEVNQLLDKTRLEMHAAVQSGGPSPKPLTQQLKSGNDSVQNSVASQAKGKKRERGGGHGPDPIKRERPTKLEDGESVSSRLDNMIKAEIPRIAEKGALVTTEDVEKLVHLVQLDKNERKIDLANKKLLADVIAATDIIECLGRFVQLRGVPVLDDWLQEAHKESDKGTEDLLLSLLRALDKLPVNLNALRTCNVGKSVNHLRSHKNIDIQKKAKSLVDIWKKRVDAEMTLINDARSGGSNKADTLPVKQGSGSTEGTTKTPIVIVKSTPVIAGSLKLPACMPALKDSELHVMTVKEEKSSGSSQSHHRRSSNGFSGCSTSGVQEANLGKSSKVSNHSGLPSERLIVRLPNPGRSPSNPGCTRVSSPGASDKCDRIDRKIELKGGSDDRAAVLDESKSRNSCSSMNALIESCAKHSEASSTCISAGDDIGINLLANVAAGEISNLDSGSPSPKEEPCAIDNEAKSRLSYDDNDKLQEITSDDKPVDYTCEMLKEDDTKPCSPDRKEEEIASSLETLSAKKLDFDLNEGFSGEDASRPITVVAAPAKGPFVPPENLLKGKGEPGWKGSAATSAFRKVLEGRPPLDIDLNVALASQRGLDIDLNREDESRGFDLNDGPGLDEPGPESLRKSLHSKNSGNVPFVPSSPAMAFPYASFPLGYVTSLPEGGSGGAGCERSRKWVGPGLDLNAGPGGADVVDASKDREGGSWDEGFYKQPSSYR